MTNIADKWGDLVAGRGFAQIPNHLLLLNQFVGPDEALSPVELLVLIQLAGSWWKKEELPFPSVATLALRCGVSQRQVQRALAKLEERELLKRVSRRKRGVIASNAYDLAPLAKALEQVAREFPNQYPRRVRSASGRPDGLVSEITLEDGDIPPPNADVPPAGPPTLKPLGIPTVARRRNKAAGTP